MPQTLEQQYNNGSSYWSASNRTKNRRHKGVFSDNNPYYEQLRLTTNKQDEDALYERAVEWEADQVNYQQQLQDQIMLRDEQREYDDPSAVVARQRRAGINPDIAGSNIAGTGSSSGATSAPSMADQTGQTKFMNSYDNTAQVMNGIGTASNLISSLASFGSTAIAGYTSLMQLPAQIKIGNAQAYVADKTKDNAVALADSSAYQVHLQNVNSSLGLISSLSSMFTPESTDEEINAILSSAGLPAESHPGYLNGIRQFQKNPQFKAYVANAEKERREAEAYNSVYTTELLSSLIDIGSQVQQSQQDFDMHISNLKASFAEKLNDEQFSTEIATGIKKDVQLSNQENAYQSMQLNHNIKSFVRSLKQVKNATQYCDEVITSVYKQALKEGRSAEKLTASEEAMIAAHRIRKMNLQTLGSNNLNNMYQLLTETARTRLFHQVGMTHGYVEPAIGMEKYDIFSQYTFGQFVSGSVNEDGLSNQLFDIGKSIVFKGK